MTSSSPSPQFRRVSDAELGALAQRFTDALLDGEGHTAERIIDHALAMGLAPEAVQTLVIAPAMARIGELWEADAITIADEHLATAISQRVLIRLLERMNARPVPARSRENVLLAAVEGQHHVLGLRMIADVLEGAGFDVLYLGGDVPVASLRAFVVTHRPADAGLAFGIAGDAERLADALWTIHGVAPETRILLGGAAVPSVLRSAGYPYVTDSRVVVNAVETLLAAPAQPLPAVVELMRSGTASSPSPPERTGETDAVAGALAKAAEQAVDVARMQLRRAEGFRELAFRDPLTGLANRRAFDDALGELVKDSGAGGAVMMLDVDAFKTINDEQGHQAGDALLRTVGHAIMRAVRAGDVAARYGGDEFAVLLPGASVEVARDIGDRIRAAVATDAKPVKVSAGVAVLAGDPRGALLAADTALYAAKAAGRNCLVCADPRPAPVTRHRDASRSGSSADLA